MKKLLVILMILALLFMFSGCSTTTGGSKNGSRLQAVIHYGTNGVDWVDVEYYERIDNGLTKVYVTDGTVYYVHPMNVMMINKGDSK